MVRAIFRLVFHAAVMWAVVTFVRIRGLGRWGDEFALYAMLAAGGAALVGDALMIFWRQRRQWLSRLTLLADGVLVLGWVIVASFRNYGNAVTGPIWLLAFPAIIVSVIVGVISAVWRAKRGASGGQHG